MLVDQNGQILSDPVNPELNFTRLDETSNGYAELAGKNEGFYRIIVNGKKYFALVTQNKEIETANLIGLIPEKEVFKGVYDQIKFTFFISTSLLVIFGIIGLFFARSLSTPINQSVNFAKSIAKGNLTVVLDYKRKDEIGNLVDELNNMKNNLSGIIQEIKVSSDLVTTGSREISSSAQQISSGANQQASSTEEISSSMEELVSNILQNSENAKKSEEIAAKAAEEAGIGGVAVKQTVEAMSLIAEKISIIEDLARNTNMLALNAAIEAARAGDAGKGFAVVASEVRKLAENSQKAAAEITEITSGSVQFVENAEKIIMELIPQINKTSDFVKDIAAASHEQNNGADQINSSIIQFDNVIQQNVISSEEMSSMAEKLSNQAEKMTRAISFFKLDENMKNGNTEPEIIEAE